MPSELSKATAHLVVRPPSYKVTIEGEDYTIKPLPNAEVELIGDAISSILYGLGMIASGSIVDFDPNNITFGAIAPIVPELIKALGNSIPKVVAAGLRVSEEFVIDNIFQDDRIKILSLIFEGEGIAFILGELQGLAGNVLPKIEIPEADQPSTPEQPTSQSQDSSLDTDSKKSGRSLRTSK